MVFFLFVCFWLFSLLNDVIEYQCLDLVVAKCNHVAHLYDSCNDRKID